MKYYLQSDPDHLCSQTSYFNAKVRWWQLELTDECYFEDYTQAFKKKQELEPILDFEFFICAVDSACLANS